MLPRAYSKAQHYVTSRDEADVSKPNKVSRNATIRRHTSAGMRYCLASPNRRWCWSPALYTSRSKAPAAKAHYGMRHMRAGAVECSTCAIVTPSLISP